MTLAALLAAGCTHPSAPARVTLRWLIARPAPAFDPSGPPDRLRLALERQLSYGLFERDAAGALHAVAADSAWTSDDGRRVTVTLRPGLRFTDGTPATSADFRAALLSGLARDDHATRNWLLRSVTGMDRVRANRPLPAIGIEAPDARTLVFHLARPDSLLLDRIASVGISAPWRGASGSWAGAVGLGPYRVLRDDPGRALTLVRADSAGVLAARVDTLAVRFTIGAPRARTALRRAETDLLWPLPPTLLSLPLPAGYALGRVAARPPRRLLLVLRADVPPTTKLPARHALVHALNRAELMAALGDRGVPVERWLSPALPFDFPALDAQQVRDWMQRGKLGASFHFVLAFDADGPGAEIARTLQGEWAALGLYAELRPLRGPDAVAEPLRAAATQAELVVAQAPAPGAAAELAALVMPLRGPAVGTFRTGWRTREFDRWIAGWAPPTGADVTVAEQRLHEERIVLPLANLPLEWVGRTAGPIVAFHPEYGPQFATISVKPAGSGAPASLRR
ncbi:MAG TPA: ABC transporter substrate-binding protein [Candidatus Acidoferrales bacterium]|nr:ABC transporter substrate-binding protein [Candidatus Acidoferrales bacterium]